LLELLLDLYGEFPSGDQYQGLNASAAALKQSFCDGNQEGKRLSGSSLRGGE